jgi:hypothetical protein
VIWKELKEGESCVKKGRVGFEKRLTRKSCDSSPSSTDPYLPILKEIKKLMVVSKLIH